MTLFLRGNKGVLDFLKTHYIVFANQTYLDSFNIDAGLCPYKSSNENQKMVSIYPPLFKAYSIFY
jgi:hypothetical protein